MGLALLDDVYGEVRRVAIAGSDLAAGDFRLKKLVPALEKAAAKAAVFGKVAEAVGKLIDSTPRDSAAALLEASTLITAILYTQGETDAEGDLATIATAALDLPAYQASARVLKPLIEALTRTGSGRLEIIVDAHRRGAFRDLRLVQPALQAIDDGFAEIADFVATHVLPGYGQAIYRDLKSSYDPKGKGGHVRRLRLLHRLDPAATRELVEQALESGSKEVKIAALECLGESEDALPYLMEQVKARSAEVRRAALRGIARFTNDEVVDVLLHALSGADLPLAAGPASQNRSAKLLDYLLAEAEKQLDALVATKDRAEGGKRAARFCQLLSCFASRDDERTLAFLLQCFQRRDELGQIKGDCPGSQVNRRVAGLLTQCRSPAAQQVVVDAQETLPPELLDLAILAAVRLRTPSEVYELFCPYLRAVSGGRKKDHQAARQKRESLREMLLQVASRALGHSPGVGDGWDDEAVFADLNAAIRGAELDPRWLDEAVQLEDFPLVAALARPGHSGLCDFLSRTLEALIQKKGDLDYRASSVLETMIRAAHPRAVDHYLDALQQASQSKRGYSWYWLARLIPELPPQAAARIEQRLPTLPEKIADDIAPYLSELKAKS